MKHPPRPFIEDVRASLLNAGMRGGCYLTREGDRVKLRLRDALAGRTIVRILKRGSFSMEKGVPEDGCEGVLWISEVDGTAPRQA